MLAIRQDADLRNQGEFLAKTHEDAFDRLTMIVQHLAGYLGMGQDGTLQLGTGDVDGAGALRARANRISGLGIALNNDDAISKSYAMQLLKSYELENNLLTMLGSLSPSDEWSPVPAASGGGNVSETMNQQVQSLLNRIEFLSRLPFAVASGI